jgi:hypothetical protein
MGEPRRRGNRGRSGRGGRIPKKGEGGPPPTVLHDETFTSFPLEITGPIEVPSIVDEAAVEAAMAQLLGRERRQAAALRALAEQSGDPALSALAAEVADHGEALEVLAKELEAAPPARSAEAESPGDGATVEGLLSEQRLAHAGWSALQAAGCAAGDRRIDRAAGLVLQEKSRHAEVLAAYATRVLAQGFYRVPEE